MKRMISFILVLCLLVPLGAISVFADDDSGWELEEYVDDFGDSTGEAYLRSIVPGTFSNTATSGESMRVILGYAPDEAAFLFRLVEYDDTLKVKATYTDTDSKVIKIKIGDEITEGTLTGTPPNGDLLLVGGACLIKIYDALSTGQEVRTIIEVANSKYTFSMDGSNFSECLDAYWESNPDLTNPLYYDKTNFIRFESLFSIQDGMYTFSSENGSYVFGGQQSVDDTDPSKTYYFFEGIMDEAGGSSANLIVDLYDFYLANYPHQRVQVDDPVFTFLDMEYCFDDGSGNTLIVQRSMTNDRFDFDVMIEYAE